MGMDIFAIVFGSKNLRLQWARQQTRTTSSILPYALYPSHWSIPVKPWRNSIG